MVIKGGLSVLPGEIVSLAERSEAYPATLTTTRAASTQPESLNLPGGGLGKFV